MIPFDVLAHIEKNRILAVAQHSKFPSRSMFEEVRRHRSDEPFG